MRNMRNIKNRSGTSQEDRALKALHPDYVSVEERSLVDLLAYLREYAGRVRFYEKEDWSDEFWSEFLSFTDDELLELADFAENPELFKDDPRRLARYSRPHLALLLTFLKLLKYPKEKFAELTAKNVEFFYRNILHLSEREEVPDQVHVIFSLARDVREHLLKKGTFFHAGKDKTGVDLHYELQEDTVLNKAQVAAVKTIHFQKAVTGLKYVHESNNRGDAGFEKILCLALGNLPHLPPYRTASGREIPVDAGYLRTELYRRIKGKERDELEKSDADYIFQSLCFRSLKDFQYCLDLLYREINYGYAGVTLPEDQEWEEAYRILEGVHRERIARNRREQLRTICKEQGFEGMMRYAFGEPGPGDLLYKMPENINTLEELANAGNEAARQYIENKLCMTVQDFRRIMAQKDQLSGTAGEEVFTLLEEAWTKKRGYVYPEIGTEQVQGFYADHIYSAPLQGSRGDTEQKGEALGEFAAFGGTMDGGSSVPVNLGFAVSSPLLRLNEGNREIEMVISCQKGSIDYEKVSRLLAENRQIFTAELSVADGWRAADDLEFAAGKFIISPEIQEYKREDAFLLCDVSKHPRLNTLLGQGLTGTYLFIGTTGGNGKIYRIEDYDEARGRIRLQSTGLEPPGEWRAKTGNRWIKRLRPKGFLAELAASLAVSRYAGNATSTVEVFNQEYEGKYLVDQNGKIFLMTKFIDSCAMTVNYCGELTPEVPGSFSSAERLFLNKVWETIDFEEVPEVTAGDLDGLVISGVYAEKKEFTFNVTGGVLKISYPEGATVEELIAAWETWKDQPQNDPGRFEIRGSNSATAQIGPIHKELEKTGRIIKRYEAPEENGLLITYQGRPIDPAFLEIRKPSSTADQASFLISGNTLIITPGRVSQTANQIAADWRLWCEQNDPQGFQVESKDQRLWEAAPVSELALDPLDRQVKKCDLCNMYGVGIRALYTGPVADEPRVVLQENNADLFAFDISKDQVLTVKYPSSSPTSAWDLVTAWEEWKASELNDPGNFDLQMLGDGLWRVQARTEKDLQAVEDQTIECTIPEAGIIAGYRLGSGYQNAIIEWVLVDEEPPPDFTFEFSDLLDEEHGGILTKKLTIKYPPLPKNPDPKIQASYRRQHVRSLLSRWNREYNKHGFSLYPIDDNAEWAEDFPDGKTVNFLDDLNYVCTIDPNGFVVKFRPATASMMKARVVIEENTTDTFAFQLFNDYPGNLRILYIRYPTSKKNRTVAEMLKAWKNEEGSLLEPGSLYWTANGELREFQLVPAGTGKWQITGVTDLPLTAEITDEVGLLDPVNQRFYEYRTKDVHGFTLYYTGPSQITPELTIAETEGDNFQIKVSYSYDSFYDLYLGRALEIKYPKNPHRRRVIDLLAKWEEYKQGLAGEADRIIGFDLVDTSPVVKERAKAALLATGDLVREYQAWGVNGACFSYTGHRSDPTVILEPVRVFPDESGGKKLLWDNGVVFTITEKLDPNTLAVAPETGEIPYYGRIKLYPGDAVCLEALKFTIRLDQDFPAVLPHPDGFTPDPAVRILFQGKPGAGSQGTAHSDVAEFYDCFKGIAIERVDLRVTVEGLKDLKMRGNISLIDPANPFAPFGRAPDLPAGFYFANEEICTKKLENMTVNIHWVDETGEGLPDMAKHYYAYSHCGLGNVGTIRNEDFEVKLEFLDKRAWVPVGHVPGEERQEFFAECWSYQDFSRQTYQGELFGRREIPRDPLEWPRYYRLELANQGFLQGFYDEVLAVVTQAARRNESARNIYETIKQEIKDYEEQVKAAKAAEAEAREKGDAYYPQPIPEPRRLPVLPENDADIGGLVVNEPYTPVIHSMSIDYQATARIELLASSPTERYGENPVRIFRFNPFGYEELAKPGTTASGCITDGFLLPRYEAEGYLFIGIKDLAPPQTVSLLFQMVSGSGDANLAVPEVTWSYLSENKWVPFTEAEILKDKTYGLQDTGIIQFQIPAAATGGNTVLPPGFHWIRAEARENVAAFPNILDIRAGAVCLTYRNRDNDPDHPATPLPAGSINRLTARDAAVKEVFQPYSSFGGRREETAAEFHRRVSERLKHKNRALTLDDYEKLILTRFPQVYKVKCLPQNELTAVEPAWRRGEVVVIVILKNANAFPFFPLRPKAPANLLAEIQRYIQELMPPQVKVTVRNPRFEEVQYRLAVKFVDGADRGFYINKLNEDLKRFLSPWAYEKEAEISFGSTIYSSSIIYYLENLDYVDYVANFYPLRQIIHHKDYTEHIPLFLTEDNAVTTKYPDSILVSAEEHVIDVITTEFFDPGAFWGIGHMKIGVDFWINRPGAVFSAGIGAMEIEGWPVLRYAFAGLPVKVKVKAVVRGVEYEEDQFLTGLSRADSQRIWDALREAGYLGEKGEVNAEKEGEIYEDVLKLAGEKGLADYLKDNLSLLEFTITATDFDLSAGRQDEFSYTVEEIYCDGLETAVLNILKSGLAFDGISQYPFIVY